MSRVNLTKAFYKFAPYRMKKLWGSIVFKVSAILDPDYFESYLLVNERVVAKLRLDRNSSEFTLALDFYHIGYRGRTAIAEVLDRVVKDAEKHLGVKLGAEVTLMNNEFLMIVRYGDSKVIFKERGSEENLIFVNGNLKLLANVKPFVPYTEDPELKQIYDEYYQVRNEVQQIIDKLDPERANVIKSKLNNFNKVLSVMELFDWDGVWLPDSGTKVCDIKESAKDAIAVLKYIILPKAKELLAEEKLLGS
jgi:hypothetical protein